VGHPHLCASRTGPSKGLVARTSDAGPGGTVPNMSSTTFMYVESDVPEGMSLDAWRRRGNATRSRPTRLARLWRTIAG